MAPISNINNKNKLPVLQRRTQTRSMNNSTQNKIEGKNNEQKRKAECSPPKDKNFKRPAFGDITNAIGKTQVSITQDVKKGPKKGVPKPPPKIKSRVSATVASELKTKTSQPIQKTQVTVKNLPTVNKPKVITIAKKDIPVLDITESPENSKEQEVTVVVQSKQERLSGTSTDSSLYVSALEEIPSDSPRCEERSAIVPVPSIPPGVDDFDKENLNDPFQVSLYAMDIFNYLKEREALFKVEDYMDSQPSISQWMRALLVDWMVEVQESFELNHETLYLGVKLVDLYLSKIKISKEILQLIGATALFVASKFDERTPPVVEDFLYICDGAYTQRELLRMECNLLRAVDFNLGIPLSYRFLRRYARCAKLALPMLTMARYILEMSLMEYSFIQVSDSRLAAAALLLALKTKLNSGWTDTLEYYSGYSAEDLKDLVMRLNEMLHKKPKDALATVRNKYSHKIFFEVAKTPLLDTLDL